MFFMFNIWCNNVKINVVLWWLVFRESDLGKDEI